MLNSQSHRHPAEGCIDFTKHVCKFCFNVQSRQAINANIAVKDHGDLLIIQDIGRS